MGWWDPLEIVWYEQPVSEDPAVFLKWFDDLSETQKVLFPTHWLCAEVYNGGFHQYFSNSTGLHAPEAVVGFRALNLDDIADIVERAIAVFGKDYPRDRTTREEFLDAIEGDDISEWNPFFELDDEFYEAIKIPGAPAFYADDRFTIAADDLVRSDT
jgi:hypothetical protein